MKTGFIEFAGAQWRAQNLGGRCTWDEAKALADEVGLAIPTDEQFQALFATPKKERPIAFEHGFYWSDNGRDDAKKTIIYVSRKYAEQMKDVAPGYRCFVRLVKKAEV